MRRCEVSFYKTLPVEVWLRAGARLERDALAMSNVVEERRDISGPNRDWGPA